MRAAIVAILICQLGSDNFPTRERAHLALQSLGSQATTQLLIGEQSSDRERAVRCRQLLDRWYADNAERLASEHGQLPWLFPYDVTAYLANGKPTVPPDYENWREATRLLVVDMYRQRASRCRIEAMLREFRRQEEVWKQNNPANR